LGDAQTIDALTITWPNGAVQQLGELKADQTMVLVEPNLISLEQIQ